MAMSDSNQLSSASQHSKLPNGSDFLGDVPGIQDFVAKREADFSAWTSLIAEIEQMSTVDVEKLCMVYDAFLAEFPLCYGYWKKYADHEAHLCNIDKVAEIHERAVQSAAYSVGLWLEYCSFGMLLFEDPVDVQRLFERAISFVGKDYLCHSLWDKYIEFAFSQRNWSSVAHIYIRTLQFPTKKLHGYYDRYIPVLFWDASDLSNSSSKLAAYMTKLNGELNNILIRYWFDKFSSFKKFSAILGEEIECPNNNDIAVQSEMVHNCEVTNVAAFEDAAITSIIKDLLDPAVDRSQALQKYLSIGEHFYQEACKMNAKICCFETHIRRPFFHVKPLDVSQLENWHRYLDFVEMQGDFDWTVKLYERCLISCANYSEFWMRYVDHMEIKGGREIASFALLRATQIFLKSVPVIHLFCARYKEQIRDISSARAALLQCDSGLDFDFVENVIKNGNMEKRVGNLGAAYSIYERALEIAAEKQKENILSMLYVHFSRFKFTVTGSIDAARDILIMGIQHMPHCKLLLEGLINFELMHGGPKLISVVDSYVANAISPSSEVSQGLNIKDREDISSLYLKFVDLCGTIHDIRMAWKRHIKLFPNLVRSNFMFKPTDSGYHALKTTIEGRQGKPVALSENTSGDDSSHGLIKHSPCNQKLVLPKSPVIHSDIAVADKSEQPNDIRHEELQQISPEVLKQSGEGASKQIRGDHDLAHKVANDTEVVQASGEHIEANEVQKMPEHERDSEDNLGQPSLENLSINPQNDEPEISVLPTLRDSEGFRETPTSSGGRSENDGNGLSLSSNPTNIGSVKSFSDHVETGSSPLCTSDPNHPSTLADPHSPSSNNVVFDEDAIQERKRHQVNHSGQAPGNPSSGFSGYPQTQQPQQWQVSPQPPHQTAEVQSQMLMNQGYPHQPVSWQTPQVQQGKPQNQHQMAAAGVPLTGSHVLSGGNMQQTFPSAPESQPVQPVSYSQAQIYPYPLSSGMQFGHVQSSQTYNPQMWNYYYQQQLQQQQYYQQPQQQQHYVQPPQHHQLQQQQPQQQYQQLQHQQQQQYQQQLQYQQLHQQQQVQQNYQQLHNQQQQIMQQRPQQQQQQLQVQAWNSSYYQQGQLPSQPNTGASGPAAYPYPQQQASPN